MVGECHDRDSCSYSYEMRKHREKRVAFVFGLRCSPFSRRCAKNPYLHLNYTDGDWPPSVDRAADDRVERVGSQFEMCRLHVGSAFSPRSYC
jgi:hypothetical protein